MSTRYDRLMRIVAELMIEEITPRHILYGTKVAQISCGLFGVNRRTARQYAQSLGASWRRYRWLNFVKGNPYLPEEVKERWIKRYSKELL